MQGYNNPTQRLFIFEKVVLELFALPLPRGLVDAHMFMARVLWVQQEDVYSVEYFLQEPSLFLLRTSLESVYITEL